MKAAEVIKKYQNGERNFQGLNLRGANFKGQNLSGADFSYCQLQSANFSQANLKDAKFIGAKAGLQLKNILLQGFLLCSLAAFPQYFLFQVFKLDTLPQDTESHTIYLILIVLTLVINGFFSLMTSLSEKISTVLGAYIFCGMIATTLALIEIRLINLEIYVVLAAMTLFITVISAICTGVFLMICEKWVIYIFPITFAIIGFIEGYTRSNENELSIIIGSIISVVGWISGIYISRRGLQENERHQWVRPIILFISVLIGATNFKNATLTDADFTGATLKNSNFNQAILTRSCFKNTVKLNLARPGNTLLENPTVRDLLINPSSGQEKNLTRANLRGANLKKANLQGANLKYADVSEATFEYANLSHANLTEVNAVYTNFNHAYLTGACIENWNIDATTILDNIDCQYVYLLNNEKERQPSSGEFKEGEFTKLFEEVFDTVNLIFENGIDWKAFIETMKTVQVENEDTLLEVSSIDNKGDGVFVVKVKVPPDANKEKIHQEFNEVYQLKLEAVEAKYKAQLEAKETEITIYRQQSIDMMEIVKTQASRPIHVEAKAMNNSSDSSKNINIRDINNSGVLNLGEIVGDVNNTINQIPESQDNKNDELKSLLQELMNAIQTENELDEDEKADAANKVKTIAKASQNPEDEGLQKKASRAVKLLETLAKGLEPATKLATSCKVVLPKIISLLPFLA